MDFPFEGLEYIDIPEKNLQLEDSNEKPKVLVVGMEKDIDRNIILLDKIMESIKISKEEYLVLDINDGQSYNLAQLHQRLGFETALVFYVPLGKLGLNIKAYRNRYLKTENFSIIISNSLSDINDNKEMKRALWESLKRNFMS